MIVNKLNRSTVQQKLNWLPICFDWPPHNYPWSSRDEKRVLLWLSTLYETAEEMITDLNEYDIHDHRKFISWLLPDADILKPWQEEIESISSFAMLDFSCNCLEKALLWHNPDYHWKSGLGIAVDISKKHLEASVIKTKLNTELNSNAFLGSNGWGDLGWIKHEGFYGDFIHTFYELLKLCENSGNELNQQDAKDLAFKSSEALLFSVSVFWEGVKSIDGDQNIIKIENNWCDKIILLNEY